MTEPPPFRWRSARTFWLVTIPSVVGFFLYLLALTLLVPRDKERAEALLISFFQLLFGFGVVIGAFHELRKSRERISYLDKFLDGFAAVAMLVWSALVIGQFVFHAQDEWHVKHLQSAQIVGVRIGEKHIQDPALIRSICSAFHRAQWSEESRGYDPTISLDLVFDDGHSEHYKLAPDLSYERVILFHGALNDHSGPGAVAIPELSDILESNHIWRTRPLHLPKMTRHILTIPLGVREKPVSRADD